ncbi:hypothetical protein LCGC14_2510000, partial [marine sediment metagenome]
MKYAIISVWDKTGVCEFARLLINKGYRILSTGGTYTAIKSSLTPEQQKNLTKVSNYTGFPEILGGRVKTLHPKIHAGILAREDQLDELEGMGLAKISVVVANLYPFAEAMQSGIEALALENIDIGGHTLIRAAAKNYPNTLVLTDPADYSHIDNLTVNERRIFAQKAFAHAAEYDISIARYFGDQTVRKYYPIHELKYGCNPHQDHAALCGINTNDVPLQVLNGSLGYINVIDALLGYQLVCEASLRLGVPAAASYKHTSPAGVGLGRELCYAETQVFDVLGRSLTPVATAFIRARNCDPLSSFGDFISISDPVDCCTAELVKREVSDGIIAPSYDDDALEILKEKKAGKYTILQLPRDWKRPNDIEYREIDILLMFFCHNCFFCRIHATNRRTIVSIHVSGADTLDERNFFRQCIIRRLLDMS